MVRKVTDVLNHREELFCFYYVEKHIGAQAAFKAGVSASNSGSWAAKKLREEKIQNRINELEDIKESGDIERLSVEEQLLKLSRLEFFALKAGKEQVALAAIKEQNRLKGFNRLGKPTSFGKPRAAKPSIKSRIRKEEKLSDEDLAEIAEMEEDDGPGDE